MILSLSRFVLYGLFALFVLFMLRTTLKRLQFIQRMKKLVGGRLNLFEEVEDDDDGFVDDEFLFGDLNPEQSVEKYRRMRFEAAAEVMGNAAKARAETARRHMETSNEIN